MKRLVGSLLTLIVFLAIGNATARDTRWFYSIDEALNTRAAKLRLDPSIKLYFGSQPHPETERSIGEWVVSRKAGGVGRTDKKTCQRTFINTLIEMQAKAKQNGANAIVNIRSHYKGTEHNSSTEFECGSGYLVSGVELKGRFVKISP